MPANPPRAPGELAEIEAKLSFTAEHGHVCSLDTAECAVILAALRSATGDGGEAKGWQPIETAPMTTDPILVAGLVFADDDWDSGYLGFWRDAPAHKARERYFCIGYMVQPASGHRCVGHRNGPVNVTHWMPLPELPALQPRSTKIEGAGE